MMIRDMFAQDINRSINGVIKVNQDKVEVIEQEVKEYVITKELKRHFISFFDYYSESFDKPTEDTGVWITGFFGSGKSHFLKMLSYILQNKVINGVPTVELFRQKFEDDPATFMLIDKSTRNQTETILFNIDIEGPMNKDKTAVLRVFAKMFYSHLGFYGENLKVALLEQYIEQQGKTEAFRKIFEQKKGKSWVEQRKAFAFNGKFIVPTLMEVLDISEEDAKRWFNDKSAVDFSISQLVQDIKAYIAKKPKGFRLLFMIDEVGQYIGTDTDMLINLQSLIEEIGSKCDGNVWVMCTGQEALDEIIKVRQDQFSRILARFKTRLSLSSSSVDEVIQKRVLKKTPESENKLKTLYSQNDSVLRNLFSFKDSVLDIKGYSGPQEFSDNFPFVPYQFIITQKVFNEIRKHGNSGKTTSGSERSMLSGFQEAAQKIQDKNEYAIVPFFHFYDTVHSVLDSTIRRVIERCERAAESHAGIEAEDVNLLKLLYLIRYIDDIPANIDNIVILMADDIRTDKIDLREKVRDSLNRLFNQNYIGRSGDIYNFLTDEEQDIAREIKNTNVDTGRIVETIAQKIYGEIYTSKKYRYEKYDFDYDKMVDGVTYGNATGGMKLRFLTVATDAVNKSEMTLMMESKNDQSIVVLSDTAYYESLEKAMKIRNYVKQRNVAQLPRSMQDIIRGHQDEATRYEANAVEELKEAIEKATFYVDGEHLEIKVGDAKSRIDQSLEYLVTHVYSELDLIDKNAETDKDLLDILNGTVSSLAGTEPNRNAAAKVEEFLIMRDQQKLPCSMNDIQTRYQAKPYGWREIDVAAVVAMLIYQQKVTIKYGGATVQPTNLKLPDMLRKRTEIGKTSISIRQVVTAIKKKRVKEFLRDYFDVMDVPDDEDGLVAFIAEKFENQKAHYEKLDDKYNCERKYPDRDKVQKAITLTTDVLSQQKDNIALIDRILKLENDLLDSKEDLQNVEGFFKNQVQIFDEADQMERDLRNELEYLAAEPEANEALNKIRLMVFVDGGFDYKKVPDLNGLMATVREGHNRLLDRKREEIGDMVTQCLGAIHQTAGTDIKAKAICDSADSYYSKKREQIKKLKSLALLDGLGPQMLQFKDDTVALLEKMAAPPEQKPPMTVVNEPGQGVAINPVAPSRVVKTYYRQVVFPTKQLANETDINEYVEKIREKLKQLLKNCDGIQLK